MAGPRTIHPQALENEFRREWIRIADQVNEACAALILSRYVAPEDTRADADDEEDEILDAVEKVIRDQIEQGLRDTIGHAARGMAQQVKTHVNRNITRQWEARYQVPVVQLPDGPIQDTMDAWAVRNTGLITNLTNQQQKWFQRNVRQAFDEGWGVDKLRDKIMESQGMGRRRAELIARDQIGSLHGQLTKERHLDMGVKYYIWRTSQDERVRPKHAELEGDTRSYREDSPDPGQEIQCRCTGEPKWPTEPSGEYVDDVRTPVPETPEPPTPDRPELPQDATIRQPAPPRRGGPADTEGTVFDSNAGREVYDVTDTLSGVGDLRSLHPTKYVASRVDSEQARALFHAYTEKGVGQNSKEGMLLKTVARMMRRGRTVFPPDQIPANVTRDQLLSAADALVYSWWQTQVHLRRRSHVLLYRGVNFRYPVWGALESWTKDASTARKYAETGEGNGYILRAIVPKVSIIGADPVYPFISQVPGESEHLVMP